MTEQSQITLRSDTLKATVLPQGAALVGLRFTGCDRNMVLGFADPEAHRRVPICAGALVGPVANRIRAGRVTLDGTTHFMPQNEGQNTLHSGPDGLHTRLWRIEKQTQGCVTLACDLADGANGLPGNRKITATYRISDNLLAIELSATTDRATPMNITAHPYWNLDGMPDVGGHRLCVSADHFLPTDAQGLPTGALQPLKDSLFDFSEPQPVPLVAALDVNFCLASEPSARPRPAAVLTGADGTTLKIATTAPGLQVYAGSNLPDLPVLMSDCPPLKPYSAIALEPQHWPDAPHHPQFPQIILPAGQTYSQTTHYTLTPP